MKAESAAFQDQADIVLARAELMLSVGLNEGAARPAYILRRGVRLAGVKLGVAAVTM